MRTHLDEPVYPDEPEWLRDAQSFTDDGRVGLIHRPRTPSEARAQDVAAQGRPPFAEQLHDALLRGDEIGSLPPIEYLIADVLPARSLSVIYGPSGHGKSFIVLGMAGAIAHGRGWHGHTVQPGLVVYVAAEGAPGQWPRLQAWKTHYGVEDPMIDLTWLPMAVNLGSAFEVSALIEVLADLDPELVIFDTQARCSVGAEENSAKDMGLMVASCDRIVAELGCAVLLVHHAGKDVSAGLRGSSAGHGAMDAVMSVQRDNESRIKFTVEKMKNGPEGVRHTFHLEPVGASVVPIEIAVPVGALPDDLSELLGILADLDEGNGVATGVWLKTSMVPHTTFHRRVKLLVGANQCQQGGTKVRPRYSLTDKGKEALGLSTVPPVPNGPTGLPSNGANGSTSLKGGTVVPTAPPELEPGLFVPSDLAADDPEDATS